MSSLAHQLSLPSTFSKKPLICHPKIKRFTKISSANFDQNHIYVALVFGLYTEEVVPLHVCSRIFSELF